MAVFFIVTLYLSVGALVGLLWLKRYELAHNRLVFAGIRPTLGDFFRSLLFWIEKILPALLHLWLARALRAARDGLHRGAAWSVIVFERGLERTLHIVREKTSAPVRGEGEPSAFLVEVANHKKKLLRRAEKNRRVEEE